MSRDRCKVCKYWKVLRPAWGTCPLFDSQGGAPNNSDAIAYAQGDWDAVIVASANFCCIQFEVKDES